MQAEANLKKKDIRNLLREELEEIIKGEGESAYRALQIQKWLCLNIDSFDKMTNLPKELRDKLDRRFFIGHPKTLRALKSAADGTIKYLWQLEDYNCVESVVMQNEYGNTVCISTEVGCNMGCAFCASTIGGKVRNLTAGEMVSQVLFAGFESDKKISNIVLMGIGEPLDNFNEVIRFLKMINDPEGMNIGMRHISLSTCGITEMIDKLASYKLQLTLSVSLHAADDETRSRLMPINRKYGVDNVLEACRRYFKATGRRISFEYAMIDGINDTPEHAALLAKRLAGTGSHVNLIPLNEIQESPFHPSRKENMNRFIDILKDNHINVTIRRRLGFDIDASCGQLRKNYGDVSKI